MRVRNVLGSLLLAGSLVSAGACTQSHDTEASASVPMAGGGGATNAGRSGSGAGRSGSGAGRSGSSAGGRAAAGRTGGAGRASAGSGSAGTPATVSCGGRMCAGGSSFLGAVPACCTTDAKCGLSLAGLGLGQCTERDAPGTLNEACPDQTIGGLLTLAGCCRPDMTCGALDTMLGLGCVALGGANTTACEP